MLQLSSLYSNTIPDGRSGLVAAAGITAGLLAGVVDTELSTGGLLAEAAGFPAVGVELLVGTGLPTAGAGATGFPELGVELLVGKGKLVSEDLSPFFFFLRAFPSNSRNLKVRGKPYKIKSILHCKSKFIKVHMLVYTLPSLPLWNHTQSNKVTGSRSENIISHIYRTKILKIEVYDFLRL